MCGRTQLRITWAQLVRLYGFDPEPNTGDPSLPLARLPRWSVAPTQPIPAVRRDDTSPRRVVGMRWGFPMMWLDRQGKDPWSRPLINTKSEDAAQKPTWADSLRHRRCVVPATGFYEWWTHGRKRFPVLFTPTTGPVLHLGGIWQTFERDGQPINCVSVLTTTANATVSPLHDRMPVVLGDLSAVDAWLTPPWHPEHHPRLMAPAPDHSLEARPMHSRLNHWSADDDGLDHADWTPADVGLSLDGSPVRPRQVGLFDGPR